MSNPKRRGSPRREQSLAEHLRDAVAASGLSIYRVAKATGVDQSTLNKFVVGVRPNLRLDVADRLFRFFFEPPTRKSRRSKRKRER